MNCSSRQWSTITQHRHGSVLVVHLNRPDQLNAINRTMREDLRQVFDQAGHDDEVSALVLAATGRAFCAGHDIKELLTLSPAEANAVMLEIGSLYRAIRAFPKPLVSALNGLTLGGGAALALFSDSRLASPEFELGFPEIDRGLVSALAPWLLGLFMPQAIAHQIVLSGARLSAEHCGQIGLVDATVSRDELFSRSLSAALMLAKKPQAAFSLMKSRFATVTEAGFLEALQAGATMQELARAQRG
ncbi:enoyl-CoA hydratase/isomerase family protein [Variovorax paradoxus]|uniref:Putative enoyl-CoA hydratase n=1 Tax=Variovorax paradoxus TaxID=34073 RepID=A0A0H2M6Z1_VARPD|nr:enoyl-CoA hydratase/isomerase family protein [Variovorax paradoxus]KLN52845.1 putative enoyl-CoA hydratase [Variovorax paradoxus]